MKYIRGFLMAWGMFCWIPCPYKKWDDKARIAQVAMFPLVGTMIGAVTCFCWWIIADVLFLSPILSGSILTGLYFLLTGFIHLDGFMDCADAIMPRHPDLEQRLRILKDPHSGAFALISLVLMILIFAGAFISVCETGFDIYKACVFIVILTSSRTASAFTVILSTPMGGSQYAGNKGKASDVLPALIILVLVVGACEFMVSGLSVMTFIFEPFTNFAALAVLITGILTGKYDIQKLGGMNGDIAGHLLVLSELAGMLVMAIEFA